MVVQRGRMIRRGFGLILVGTATISFLAMAAPTPSPSPTINPGPVTTKTCGLGVCKRTVPAAIVCTPGKPITENDGWLYSVDAATSSWDANCDGTVEKKPLPTDTQMDLSLA